ncbi:class II aldolase/adducin family protein [Kibdelosporangium aridum]|uniref:Class II aldolase/adducin family protein n=1 Tax=Kibdelosporangium aridum TaxID=2030 RepID=A0A428Z4T1_KIBAR|nr:class II aldolase/adducin family protein [Kibdelosporangium aridum]RSM81612.1 class II aldolase/adducin family protein [Kibdelosporangium aridum]
MDEVLADEASVRREEVKEELIEAIQLFALLGYGEGIAGHISVTDPDNPDCYWVNPFGLDFHEVRVRDLLYIGPQGTVLAGRGAMNPSVDPLHGELHRARPDLAAFAHTHSLYGKAWSSLGRVLDPITQDACALYGRHAVYAQYDGLVNDRQEGKEVVATMGAGTAVILQNHGFLTGGRSVAEAAWLFVVMERAAQVQLLAEAAGKPIVIPHEIAQPTAETLAGLEYAELQFRNLYRSTVMRRR